MLKNYFVGREDKLTMHGFLVGVETADGVDVGFLCNRLADALSFIEGVGKVEVNYIGPIEIISDEAVIEADSVEVVKES